MVFVVAYIFIGSVYWFSQERSVWVLSNEVANSRNVVQLYNKGDEDALAVFTDEMIEEEKEFIEKGMETIDMYHKHVKYNVRVILMYVFLWPYYVGTMVGDYLARGGRNA